MRFDKLLNPPTPPRQNHNSNPSIPLHSNNTGLKSPKNVHKIIYDDNYMPNNHVPTTHYTSQSFPLCPGHVPKISPTTQNAHNHSPTNNPTWPNCNLTPPNPNPPETPKRTEPPSRTKSPLRRNNNGDNKPEKKLNLRLLFTDKKAHPQPDN